MRDGFAFSRFWLSLWTGTVIVFVTAPLLFVVLVSLTPLNHISLPTTGLSLKWYARLMQNGDLLVDGGDAIGQPLRECRRRIEPRAHAFRSLRLGDL